MIVTMRTGALIILTLLFGSCISLPSTVSAASSYTVSPLVIDENLEARDIITKTITITNTGTQPATVFPSVNNISLDGGGTIQEFIPPVMSDRTSSLSSWIEISRAGINLMLNDTKTVDLTLRINPAPKPGIYHALIGFGNGRNRDEAEAMVKNGQAPGVIITVTIEDKKVEMVKMSRFYIDKFVTGPGNQALTYSLDNPGDIVIAPRGEVIFYNNRGVEVGTLTINPEQQMISPGETHEFTAEVPTQGLFGKYKALLNVEYGTTQKASLQDTTYFYVFPLKISLIVFTFMLIMIIILALFIHRRYYGDDVHEVDADSLMVHIRDSVSPSRDHDIDLKKK